MRNKQLKITTIVIGLVSTLMAFTMYLVPTYAQESSPTPSITGSLNSLEASPSADTDTAQIKTLRDKLASVVANMRKKDQKVVAGDLKKISGSTVELETVFGSSEKAILDEALTKFYRIIGAATEEVKREDLKESQYIIVTGPHLDGKITANEIYIDEHFESRAGRITDVNTANATLKLETFDKDTISVTISRSTSLELLNSKTVAVEQGGFARIKEGDIAHIVYPVKSISEKKVSVTPSKVFVISSTYFTK